MGSSCDQLGIAVRTTVVHKENLHCRRIVISSSGFFAFLRLCFSWDCFKFELPLLRSEFFGSLSDEQETCIKRLRRENLPRLSFQIP